MASIAKFFILVIAINLVCGMVAQMHNSVNTYDYKPTIKESQEGLYEQINTEPAQSNDQETSIGNAVELGGIAGSFLLNSINPFSIWYGEEDTYSGFIKMIAIILGIIRTFLLVITTLVLIGLWKNRERVL